MNRAHSCSVYKKCGGCQLTNLSYQEQLSYKMKREISLLGKFCRVDEIIGMDDPYHYRNKMQAMFALDGGRIISGVWQSASSRIVKTDSCMIEDEVSLWIVRAARGMLSDFGIQPYNMSNGKGTLRHITVRRAFATGEIMVVLVTADKPLKNGKRFAETLVRRFPHIRTVVQCINDTNIPLWMGEKETVLWGEGYIEDVLCGCWFRISAKSFYQVNPKQTEVLYNVALDLANLKEKDTVLDAYCGIGTIGIVAAAECGKVIGVEVNESAVKNAMENCRLNHTGNFRVYKGDAGEFMEKLAREGKTFDTVFMDPPRAGCSKKFLQSLVTSAPKKAVYVSCNPETLSRDLSYLTKNGYRVMKIQPVDLFPHTVHVETAALLVKER